MHGDQQDEEYVAAVTGKSNEPLSRERLMTLTIHSYPWLTIHAQQLLDELTALRAQHTADEFCIKAQADELTRLRAQFAQLEQESIQITASLHDDDIPETEPLSLNVEDVRSVRRQLAQRIQQVTEAQEAFGHWQGEVHRAEQQLAEARAEITVADKLLTERNRILEALPCPTHGPCVPYVLHWIAETQARIQELLSHAPDLNQRIIGSQQRRIEELSHGLMEAQARINILEEELVSWKNGKP